jgi:arylsulfatase A-like enzyme
MDVAPTLLDYLGLEKPGWMQGESLLHPLMKARPIIAVKESGTDKENGKLAINPAKVKPPFFQFGSISVVECNLWYLYSLKDNTWTSGTVAGSTTTCKDDEKLTAEQTYQVMVNHLKENGFDVSSLNAITPYINQ